MKCCHRCGGEWLSDKRQPGVKECCAGCNAYLYCCLNCRFHDRYAHNECQIPNTEWVADRAGCNFCDEFEFVERDVVEGEGEEQVRAKDAFGRLFGRDGADGDGLVEKGKDAFDKLFSE